VRFTCEVISTSEETIRYVWESIGVKAAIGEIQHDRKRIHFYAELMQEKRNYPDRIRTLIEESGVKVLGDINLCGLGITNAAAAYMSVESGRGTKFYYQRECFNQDMICHVLKKTTKTSPSFETAEFDVVKKRRMMDSAPPNDGDTDPEALQHFEDFEASVLPALREIGDIDHHERYSELLLFEEEVNSGIQQTKGGVYVSISKAVKYPKIGATRKSDPAQRMKEISKCVPSPFKVVYWIPTTTPFKVEAEIHKHFGAYRIREAGACTEFFNIDLPSIGAHLTSKYVVIEKEGYFA